MRFADGVALLLGHLAAPSFAGVWCQAGQMGLILK
jgi:hypothetical protein